MNGFTWRDKPNEYGHVEPTLYLGEKMLSKIHSASHDPHLFYWSDFANPDHAEEPNRIFMTLRMPLQSNLNAAKQYVEEKMRRWIMGQAICFTEMFLEMNVPSSDWCRIVNWQEASLAEVNRGGYSFREDLIVNQIPIVRLVPSPNVHVGDDELSKWYWYNLYSPKVNMGGIRVGTGEITRAEARTQVERMMVRHIFRKANQITQIAQALIKVKGQTDETI